MAGDDRQPQGRLEVAASAASAVEADVITQRLAAAGITAITQRAIGGPEWGVSGAQYVYVEADQLERAREILGDPGGVDQQQLTRLAEEGEDG
jgi:hypothetical protein